MHDADIRSPQELAKKSACSRTAVRGLLTGKLLARGVSGQWIQPAIQIAEAFECHPHDLFDFVHQWGDVSESEEIVRFEELTRRATAQDAKSQDDIVDDHKMHRTITSCLSVLPARHERVIRMYFGIGCEQVKEDEIAEEMSVSKTRVWQLKEQALSFLDKPRLRRSLMPFVGIRRAASQSAV
jgi:biotin operon repressor